MASDRTASRRPSAFWRIASACALAVGCNDVLGNAEHDVSAEDPTRRPSLDGASSESSAPDSATPESGVSKSDAGDDDDDDDDAQGSDGSAEASDGSSAIDGALP